MVFILQKKNLVGILRDKHGISNSNNLGISAERLHNQRDYEGHASISYNYNLANVFIKQVLLKNMDAK